MNPYPINNPQAPLLQQIEETEEFNLQVNMIVEGIKRTEISDPIFKLKNKEFIKIVRSLSFKENYSDPELKDQLQKITELSDLYQHTNKILLSERGHTQVIIDSLNKSISNEDKLEYYKDNLCFFNKRIELMQKFQEEELIKNIVLRFNTLILIDNSLSQGIHSLHSILSENITDPIRCQNLIEMAHTVKCEYRQVIAELLSEENDRFLKEIGKNWSAYLKIKEEPCNKNKAIQTLQERIQKYEKNIPIICAMANIQVPENTAPQPNRHA